MHEQPAANVLNGEKLKAFPLKAWTRQGFPYIYLMLLEVIATAVTQEIKVSRLEGKKSLFVEDMVSYIENSKDFTKKINQPNKKTC